MRLSIASRPGRRPRLSLWASLAPLALALGAPGGCNQVLSTGDYDVGEGSGSLVSCSSSRACVEALGPYSACRQADSKCVKLTSEQCTTVYGDYQSDDAIFFGTVFPLTGTNATTGRALQNSVELAARDLDRLNGLPPAPGSSAQRPVVIVQCDDASNGDEAVRAAAHLTSTVRVPVIIGSNATGVSRKMATEVTIKGGVMLVSPSATGRDLTELEDQGLFWRTAPTSVLQVDTLVQLLPYVEADLRSSLGLGAADKIKIGAAVKSDGFGTGLLQGLIESKSFVFNGAPGTGEANRPYFLASEYGNPDDAASTVNYQGTVDRLLEALPHIIFVFGSNEAINEVLPRVEDGWPASAPYRPLYLFTDSGYKADLWRFVSDRDPSGDGLRRRVLGVIFGAQGTSYENFRVAYTSNFNDGSQPDVLGTPNAYDAFYLMAYAAVAAGGTPLSGRVLADNMAKLVAGTTINVGAGDAGRAFGALRAGQGIDFVGASGPLNFDLATGEALSDIQIWCVKMGEGASPKPEPQGSFAGPKLSADTNALVGEPATSAFSYAQLKQRCEFSLPSPPPPATPE
ncbi:MAG: ABC transporter substrate-binding protein [Polyangiaceae bacterium]|nr:ABC transporter substrate-binding protein [Polyangiaceae bacterium]